MPNHNEPLYSLEKSRLAEITALLQQSGLIAWTLRSLELDAAAHNLDVGAEDYEATRAKFIESLQAAETPMIAYRLELSHLGLNLGPDLIQVKICKTETSPLGAGSIIDLTGLYSPTTTVAQCNKDGSVRPEARNAEGVEIMNEFALLTSRPNYLLDPITQEQAQVAAQAAALLPKH